MTAELGQPGQIIDGKYRIVRLLGTGGMGAVYEGENVRIRRKVAIKMLHGAVSSQPEVVARFEREAQAAGMVGSEHICEVLDLGVLPDQTRYMVMEYLDGETLSSLIKRNGRLTPQQSIPLLVQILEALQAAHTAGIIHRDLKPDNVFILPQRAGAPNFVKILDFGVSKFSQLSGESMNVTRAGAVVGTPYYMSPEQARGGQVDNRTDIYAIGVLLYQASTGYVPYQAETFNELLFKIVLEVAPPPQTYVPDIDPAFASIIQKAMAREPPQRFQSCIEFRDALLQFQQARQNPLPAYNLPRFHEDHGGAARTEVIDVSQPHRAPNASSPSGANWQAAGVAADGTLPMQPGIGMAGGNTGPGLQPSPLQSGAGWPAASSPGAQPPPGMPPNTANSWGNASSPNAAQRPKSGNGALIGVVAVAALVGVGVAVGAVVMMKPGKTTTAATAVPTATAAPPTATATAAAPPTATATATTAPVATNAQPSASASTSAAPVDTGTKPSTGKAPPPPVGTGAAPKPGGTAKPATGKTGKSGKSSANDLGY